MTKDFHSFKKQQLTYTRSNSLPSGLLPGIPEGSRLTTPSVTVSDFSVATCGSEINLRSGNQFHFYSVTFLWFFLVGVWLGMAMRVK